MKHLVILFLLTLSIACAHKADNDSKKASSCGLETRAAFDVGSGTTKMVLAQFDTCENRVTEVLKPTLLESGQPAEHEIAVAYKEDLEKAPKGQLSASILEEGATAISTLMTEAIRRGATKFAGVATSAFRLAKNKNQAVEKIEKATGIRLEVISQEREAALGFYAGAAVANQPIKDILVWDIGGSSMQLSLVIDGALETHLTRGKNSSVGFKNHVLQTVQGVQTARLDTASPNPLGEDQATRVVSDIAESLKTEVDGFSGVAIQRLINERALKVIGIGGVHYYSIRGQMGKKSGVAYSYNELMDQLKLNAKKNDCELAGYSADCIVRMSILSDKGTAATEVEQDELKSMHKALKYKPTDVTNMALVAGFMKGLGMDRVTPYNINMAHGILGDPGVSYVSPGQGRK